MIGIVLKVKQFNFFFEPHTCPEAGGGHIGKIGFHIDLSFIKQLRGQIFK